MVEAKNTLDGMHYAIKVVTLKTTVDSSAADKVLREVTHLASLDHSNVVRYNAAWLEYGYSGANRPPRAENVSRATSGESEFSYDEPDGISPLPSSESGWMGHESERPSSTESSFWPGLNATGVSRPADRMSVASSVASADGGLDTGAHTIDLDAPPGTVMEKKRASGPRLRLYIQMQLCDFSLHDWLRDRAKNGGTVVPSTCVGLFTQVLAGIVHIHEKGLIHRDVKPRNIFLKGSTNGNVPQVKLGDFGLATTSFIDVDEDTPSPPADSEGSPTSPMSVPMKSTGSSPSGSLYRTELTSGVGTGTYASPEQLSKCAYDKKADIYSLGTNPSASPRSHVWHPSEGMSCQVHSFGVLWRRLLLPPFACGVPLR